MRVFISSARLFLRVLVALAPSMLVALVMSFAPVGAVAAQDACADLAGQVAAQEQALDGLRSEALPWLLQANRSAAGAVGELSAVAAQGNVPLITPELAATDGALAAQIGLEMAQFASGAETEDSVSFARDFANRILDWQLRLASLQPVAPNTANLTALLSAAESLTQYSGQAQAALALRDGLSQALAACQSAHPQTPALGCGLTYFGLDRSTPQPALRSGVPALPAGAKPGDQWTSATEYTTAEGAQVQAVDTYTCTNDGATKVGRSAIQTDPDGSTVQWDDANYVGTLWPKAIAPGAAWQWQAMQFFGDSAAADSAAETWNVSVHEAARESLQLPQGKFEAIQLHMEEDVVQPDGDTQHFSWDEWYARPQP